MNYYRLIIIWSKTYSELTNQNLFRIDSINHNNIIKDTIVSLKVQFEWILAVVILLQ